MAVINSTKGKFQITSITFSPDVIAMGESTHVVVKVKNTSDFSYSGIALSVLARGSYASSDSESGTGICAEGDLYLRGKSSSEPAVTWPANAALTFSFDYTFSEGDYAADVTSYIMSKSLLLSIGQRGAGSHLSYDIFEDITGDVLTVLSQRDNPRLAMALERANDGVADDEGESLLTDLALTGDTTGLADHGYTASILCDPEVECSLNATVAEMIAGITASTSAISGTFSNGADYDITVTVTNGYETAVAKQSISRAFANVHMSGASTGGVCFGGFSSAKEGNPKFECYYPAYFYGGIHGSDAYEDGDVVTLTDGTFYGYVSNSSKSINFTVPLRKSLENINSATITTFMANIANGGGYGISSSFVTGGSSYMGSAITRTVKIYKETNCLEVNLVRSSAWDLTNNDTLSVRNESLVITLNE